MASWQYFYEIAHTPAVNDNSNNNNDSGVWGCTSIVACDTAGGIVHGRNLDYSWPTARNTTVHTTFTRGGRVLYAGPSVAGTVTGVSTGVLPGRFTFSYNWRMQALPLADVLRCVQDPAAGAPFSSFARSVFGSGASFAQAVKTFSNTRLCAAAYVILGGTAPTEGVVLTRSHNESLRPQRIGKCRLESVNSDGGGGCGCWYVAQTNYDAWTVQPPKDDRLGIAVAQMESLGQEAAATPEGMWKVLSTLGNDVSKGVLNAQTLYTSIMAAGKNAEYTKIRTLCV